MAGSSARRRAHVLERVPPARGYSESSQITEIGTIFRPPAEDIHDIVDYGSGVALARNRYVSYTIQLRPLVRRGIITPDVVEPLVAIRAAEPIPC